MNFVARYRTYAADALQLAKETQSQHERTCLLAVAQGWLELATIMSIISGGAF
jgi:hypothetical protein